MNNNLTWKEDLATELSNRASSLVIVESSLMVLINLISAVGNITLCYVIYKTPSLQTRTNTYIIALAVSDTLMALMVMPLTVGVLIHDTSVLFVLPCTLNCSARNVP
ncbi:neuromedin-U receptor 2-like [Actinia tenebrosa]|uniref:Neuromedin-U receptor 2-like n=1 Tax=Actinia tenebrosa TaxID=6105 RepID=A0A6P8HVE1_ACTTE|nr:neuromedin-U receptor 2-like [Actinia tenebrosa]